MLTSKFNQGRVPTRPRKVIKGEMEPFHELLYKIVHKGIMPRGKRRHEASLGDMRIANALEQEEPIAWPSLMIQHIARLVDPKPDPYQLAFENLLTLVFKAFGVPLGEVHPLNKKAMITRSTLTECSSILVDNQAPGRVPGASGPILILCNDCLVLFALNFLP